VKRQDDIPGVFLLFRFDCAVGRTCHGCANGWRIGNHVDQIQ